jgi:D-alanyl-D-alanine carboxypeptidase
MTHPLGFDVLKGIIERVAGAPWETVLAARVLRPLGLGHTRVATTMDALRAVVPAYSAAVGTDGLCHDIRQCYHPGWVAHGVVLSTPRDMVAFYRGVCSGGLRSAQSVREMTALVPVPGAHFRTSRVRG